MNVRKISYSILSIGALLSVSIFSAHAMEDKADILIKVLVQKGILSEEEAAGISQEVDAIEAASAQFPAVAPSSAPVQSYSNETYIPMPRKLSGLKLYGDARFRYQYENAQKLSGANNERSRWRYRARFGAEYDFADSPFSMGARLETASANDSTNVNFGGFFDKTGDELSLGLIYMKYEGEDWDITLGKHKNPFNISSAWWDSDINPEGITESTSVGDWSFTFGQYVIDEERESRQSSGGPAVEDDFLLVAQAEVDLGENLTIAPIVMTTTSGVSTQSESAGFSGENAKKYFDSFTVVALPFSYSFKTGGVSQKISGTYGVNLQGDDALNDPSSPFYSGMARSGSRNQFFNIGYQYGSAKKAGSSQFKVEYRFAEAASFTPNLSDSDFGKNHLNQEGFILQGRHAFTDFMSSTLTIMFSDTIDGNFSSSVADAGKVDLVQLDAAIKF